MDAEEGSRGVEGGGGPVWGAQGRGGVRGREWRGGCEASCGERVLERREWGWEGGVVR